MRNLKGKTAVVLGASAKGGTGWAIAEAFAEHGANVVVASRSYNNLKILAEKIGGHPVKCDASSEQDIEALAKAALDTYGSLDIAINSAGASFVGFIDDMTPELLKQNADLNFFGHVYFVKHMARAMGQRELGSEGSIILITTMGATNPMEMQMAYASSKAATDCMVRYAALEYGPQRVKVNSILPGAILSDMAREVFADPAVRERFVKEVPAGRLGEPEDFADACLWLAGPAYTTGLNLQLNGGNHITRFPYISELPSSDHTFDDIRTVYDRDK